MASTAGRCCSASNSRRTSLNTNPTLCDLVGMRLRAALTLVALWAPATAAAVDGPITRLATVGGRPDVLARADGSAVAGWGGKPTAAPAPRRLCRGPGGPGAGTPRPAKAPGGGG